MALVADRVEDRASVQDEPSLSGAGEEHSGVRPLREVERSDSNRDEKHKKPTVVQL